MELATGAMHSELKRRIMRRVYGVWFWRSVAPLLAVEVILLSGVAAGVLAHISVRAIMVNALSASSGADAFAKFFIRNFFIKSIQSRLLFASYLVFLAFFARDIWGVIRRLTDRGAGELFLASRFTGNQRRAPEVL